MPRLRNIGETPRVLDFDTECRPMHYSEWRPESQITAYAWSFVGSDDVRYAVLAQDLNNERDALEQFLEAYNEADVVVGHYIRKHDLPLLNDHCVQLLGRTLPAKLTHDTMLNLPKVKGLGKSQDNLCRALGVDAAKHHMSGAEWKTANSLTPAGQHDAVARVVGDVVQNKALYRKERELGLLKAPTMWRP